MVDEFVCKTFKRLKREDSNLEKDEAHIEISIFTPSMYSRQQFPIVIL